MFLLFEHMIFIFSSVCKVVNKSESVKKELPYTYIKNTRAGKRHKYPVIKILFLSVR